MCVRAIAMQDTRSRDQSREDFSKSKVYPERIVRRRYIYIYINAPRRGANGINSVKISQRPADLTALLTHDSYGAPPALVLGTLERHDAHCAVVVDAARGGDVAAVTREGRAVRAEDAEEAHLGKGQV